MIWLVKGPLERFPLTIFCISNIEREYKSLLGADSKKKKPLSGVATLPNSYPLLRYITAVLQTRKISMLCLYCELRHFAPQRFFFSVG